VNTEVIRHIGLDMLQKAEESLVPVARAIVRQHATAGVSKAVNKVVVPCRGKVEVGPHVYSWLDLRRRSRANPRLVPADLVGGVRVVRA
jgi:hypothetical protein